MRKDNIIPTVNTSGRETAEVSATFTSLKTRKILTHSEPSTDSIGSFHVHIHSVCKVLVRRHLHLLNESLKKFSLVCISVFAWLKLDYFFKYMCVCSCVNVEV